MWDVRVFRGIEFLLGSFSVSVLFCPVGDAVEWWFSGVYGPCRARDRKELWEELAGLFGLCGDRGCLGGNFNVVRYPSEKIGGGSVTRSMKDFDSFIRETNLRDIAINNSEFTWSNMRERLACSRIDRFLFSEGWEEMSHSVRQEALIRATSDHCPVVLDTNNFKWGPTLFRFENMWLRRRDYKANFKNWWENSVHHGCEGFKFMKRLEEVKGEVKKWNKEVFGYVRVQKIAIMDSVRKLDEKENSDELDEKV